MLSHFSPQDIDPHAFSSIRRAGRRMDSLDGSGKEELRVELEGDEHDKAPMGASEKTKSEPMEGSHGELDVGKRNGKLPVATMKVLTEDNSDHECDSRRHTGLIISTNTAHISSRSNPTTLARNQETHLKTQLLPP